MFPIAETSNATFSINRIAPDFTEEQRDLMTLLVPHFRQAWARANAISQRDSALAAVAVAEVDPLGQILFATERASKLIRAVPLADSLCTRTLPEPSGNGCARISWHPKRWGVSAAGSGGWDRRLTVRLAAVPDQTRINSILTTAR